MRQGYRHIVNIDLSKFFDRVNHDALMNCLSRHVGDKQLLKLIGRYLRAGVMVEGVVQPTAEGTPQGGPLSPFLSNVLLDVLDKELERRGHKFVRYADGFVIFVKSSRSAQRVHHSVERFLKEKLKLIVNEDKSSHGLAEGCEYLGFQFKGRRATIKVSPKKLQAFKRRVKELTGRSRGVSMERRLIELRRYLRGWTGYFALAQQVEDFLKFDTWIRRRIRMGYWKQWRYPRTKIRKLIELGVSRRLAILHGISRKGYWRMSRTPAMRIAMPNDWLKEQGLPSIAEQWFHLAPLRRTA
ncbi:MAG: reverse transcriptase domain-containing protein [Planctomycetota bacterium]